MTISARLKERYGKAHLSYSSVKNALGDMAQFDRYMKGELKYKSDALEFGTLYDMLLFEKDKAMERYCVVSDDRILSNCSEKTRKSTRYKLTTEYKQEKAKLEAEAAEDDQILCSSEDWKTANDMIDRLRECGLHSTFLSGKPQVEFNEEIDSQHGPVLVKGFLDCLNPTNIVDSKSTKSVAKFRYSVRDFSYDIQAYIYCTVFDVEDFYWVAQEKTYPYLPALVKCSQNTMFTGEMKFHDGIDRIVKFLNGDEKPTVYFEEYEV
jgi:hypothetical protein